MTAPGDVVNGDRSTGDGDFTDDNSSTESGSIRCVRRGNDNSRRSHGGAVCGSGNNRVDSCAVMDLSSNNDDGHAGDENDGGGDVGTSTAGRAAVCGGRGGLLNEDVAFVRQQRMKWLEAKERGTTKQSDAHNEEMTRSVHAQPSTAAERPVGPSLSRLSDAHSSGRGSQSGCGPVVASGEDCLPVVGPRTHTVVSRPLTAGLQLQAPPTASANCVGQDAEPTGNAENSVRNFTDGNRAGICSTSGSESSSADSGDSDGSCGDQSHCMKVTVFGTATDVSERTTETAAKENSGDQKPRCTTSSYSGTVERQITDSESQSWHQRVPDAGASASLRLALDEDRGSSESRPKPVVVEVQELAKTTAASVCSDRPLTDFQARLSSLNDVNVTSAQSSAEAQRTCDHAAPKTSYTVYPPELHNAFDDVDSGPGLGARSHEVLNSCTVSLSFDKPLIEEEEFDIYMKVDGSDVWLPGRSTLQSFSAEDDFTSIDPPEGFADSDDTLLKLPVSSASQNASDEREEVCSAAETHASYPHASVNELPQSDRLNTPDAASNARGVSAPRCSAKSWTCVYSREGVGVGEVSTRFSPAYCEVEAQNSVLEGVTTAVAPAIEGIVAKNAACSPPRYQDTVSESAFYDTNQSLSEETSQCHKVLQEVENSTRRQPTCVSAENCMETALPEDVRKNSSDNVRRSNTTEQEPVCPEVNAADQPIRWDSTDSVNSVPLDKLTRLSDADNRLEDTKFEIPAEMEADFIDQMYHETCPNALRSSTEEFFAEMSLTIVISHVVDARHFWGQIVNEGIQVAYVSSVFFVNFYL